MSDAGHSHDHDHSHEPLWKHDGVRVIGAGQLIEPAEKPQTVLWIDPTHPQGGV
jgi:hypothetical protein